MPPRQNRATSEPAPSAPAIHATPKGAKLVTVCCKHPNGLVLQLYKEKAVAVEWRGERIVEKQYLPDGDSVTVDGPAVPRGGQQHNKLIVGGYALTPNIDADLWRAWYAANKDTHLVRSQQIMGFDRRADALAWCRDHREVLTGLEPMNPEGDPRAPKPINAGNSEPVIDPDSPAARFLEEHSGEAA